MADTRVRALRVRLDPNDVQAGLLLRRAGARRTVYNFGVEMLRRNGETWRRQAAAGVPKEDRVKVPSHFDLIRRWTGADGLPAARDLVCRDRATGETWWHEHPAQMFQAALKDVRENYGKHLRGEARTPKFLAGRHDLPRFRASRGVVLESGRLRFEGLPRGMWLRVAHTCPGQAKLRRLLRRDRATVASVTVKRDRAGQWWAIITYTRHVTVAEPPAGTAPPRTGQVVGVDVGVKTLAVAATSDGTLVAETATSAHYKTGLRRLRRAQRTVSRRTRPGRGVTQSANRAKAQRQVAVLHDRIHARRANDLHHTSKAIVTAAGGGTVVVEDLNVAGMMAKKRGAGARGRGFNRAIADQGFGELRRQVTYKAETAGVGLLVAGRFYPSSKTCASCEAVRLKLPLDVRTFHCEACGHTGDRDLNAARNLAAWGERELGITGCACSQNGDRDPRGPTATPGNGEPTWHACGPASAGHQTTEPERSGEADGGGTGRSEAGTRQPTASRPRRQRGTSRTGTSTTARDEPITTRS